MGEPLPFFYEDKRVRVVVDERTGDLFFHLGDCCAVLGLGNVGQVKASRLEDKYLRNIIINDVTERQRNQVFVSEPGLYDLIMLSRKPEAKKFKEWVLEEVLPTLRKTGTYRLPGVLSEEELPPETIERLHSQVMQLMERIQRQQGLTIVRHDQAIVRLDKTVDRHDQALLFLANTVQTVKNKVDVIDIRQLRHEKIQETERKNRQKAKQRHVEDETREAFRVNIIRAAHWRCMVPSCRRPLVLHAYDSKDPQKRDVLAIDHVDPCVQGGNLDYDNAQAFCMSCNQIKKEYDRKGLSARMDFRDLYPEFKAEMKRIKNAKKAYRQEREEQRRSGQIDLPGFQADPCIPGPEDD